MSNASLLSVPLGVLTLLAAFWGIGWRWNLTASAPRGFYSVTSPRRGSYLAFCPEDRGFSATRGYRLWGWCDDWRGRVLKPIVGWPGQTVRVTAEGTWIHGRLLPHTAPSARDSAGRPLTPYPFGTYRLGPGQFWTVSTYDPRSYDSRYFGPVRDPYAEYLEPVWTEGEGQR